MKKIFLALALVALGLFAGLPATASGGLTNNGTPAAQPPSGDNSKIIGTWTVVGSYYDSMFGRNLTSYHTYTFNSNGTFEAIYSRSDIQKYMGKYFVSDGKVYFTEIKRYRATSNDFENFKDHNDGLLYRSVTMEYESGTDSSGEYLHIHRLGDGQEEYFKPGYVYHRGTE